MLIPMLYSIGHSTHVLDKFISLLKQHEIDVVSDVRSAPYSKYASHFDKAVMERELPSRGVEYRYMGDVLGGRPEGEEYYDESGFVLYNRLAKASFFVDGLDRLVMASEEKRVAIMCSEENPETCHRHLLISRVLAGQGIDVRHIRGTGEIETYEQVHERLSAMHPERMQEDLFATSGETEWKSTRSVLRENRPRNSSDY